MRTREHRERVLSCRSMSLPPTMPQNWGEFLGQKTHHLGKVGPSPSGLWQMQMQMQMQMQVPESHMTIPMSSLFG